MNLTWKHELLVRNHENVHVDTEKIRGIFSGLLHTSINYKAKVFFILLNFIEFDLSVF